MAVSRVDDRQVGNVTQNCEYDAYANPVDCRLVIVDESVKPAVTHHYTIKNRIDITKTGRGKDSLQICRRVYCAVIFRSVEPDVYVFVQILLLKIHMRMVLRFPLMKNS